MVADNLLQRLKDLWVFLAEPVDGQRHLVVMIMELTRCIAGEFQDGWSTHAPVGDEQRTCGSEIGAWDIGCGTFYHCAHQGAQGWVFDGEGEEGGDW